jgi:hypothetical protein
MSVINSERTRARDKRGHWLPGQSGNPAGRPPEPESITACLRKRLAEFVPIDTPAGVKRVTRADALALGLCELAAAGSVRAHAVILERLDGKPAQAVSLSVQERLPCPEPVWDDVDRAQIERVNAVFQARQEERQDKTA